MPSPKPPLQRSEYQSLVLAIQQRASELGFTVRGLAEALDRPRATVHKTLRGQRRMDPIEFFDWCDVLDIDDPAELEHSK